MRAGRAATASGSTIEPTPIAGIGQPALRPRWVHAARIAVLSAADFLSLVLAGAIAFLLWAHPIRGQQVGVYLPAVPVAMLVVLCYAQARLYPGFGLGPVETFRRYWLVTGAAFLGIAALVFVLKMQYQYSRVTLLLAMSLSLVLVPLVRWLVLKMARDWSWWPEPVLVVGDVSDVEHTRQLLGDRAGAEFEFVGVLHVDGGSAEQEFEIATSYANAGVGIALVDTHGPGAEPVIDRLRHIFPRVIAIRRYDELPVEGVQLRNLGGVLGLEYGNNLLSRQSRWVKRTLDIGLAAASLVVLLPLIAVALAAVKLLSPGPAIFWHDRGGHGGRPIRVPKIRTMVLDAERRMEEVLRERPDLRAEWEAAFKLREDPRVIPMVGRLFRRFSIDELPQLWSVIVGDMSLVGPRPFPEYHLNVLSPHVRRLRGQVRPGITGLWQVTARGDAGVTAQQAHDIYYIRNWSPWLDLYIIGRTFSAVLSGRGAY